MSKSRTGTFRSFWIDKGLEEIQRPSSNVLPLETEIWQSETIWIAWRKTIAYRHPRRTSVEVVGKILEQSFNDGHSYSETSRDRKTVLLQDLFEVYDPLAP